MNSALIDLQNIAVATRAEICRRLQLAHLEYPSSEVISQQVDGVPLVYPSSPAADRFLVLLDTLEFARTTLGLTVVMSAGAWFQRATPPGDVSGHVWSSTRAGQDC